MTTPSPATLPTRSSAASVHRLVPAVLALALPVCATLLAAPSATLAATTHRSGAIRQDAAHTGATAASPALAPVEAPSAPRISGVPTPARLATTVGGTVALTVRSTGLLGHSLRFSGRTVPGRSPQLVVIQRLEPHTGAWLDLASAPVGAHGAYTVPWQASVPGRLVVRAELAPAPGGGGDAGTTATSLHSSPSLEVTIYRASEATYFGPGLYGEGTACGQRLTPYIIGVANRTLRCGTLVELSYHGESLVVPVIDRGPYRHGVSWDLTTRAAQLLGAEGMERIGALVVGLLPDSPLLGVVPGAESQSGGSQAPSGP
ncbi:MAG: septal ring lytic transglycosylase RlpA family protein [Solirubrobacteraceae bacterium]